ncbi:hypothetical protein DEO72_LG4g1118 [Vigna unguiculata]|uniref:Uncharacterized protein n=1 Tax=Vigna unguiculata TaxID=3917 RepID=A0A4D6LMV8_VIGUN|nr:hypothetical protein DEO72_LG4g1117 [Vigna unguiculata]QCD90163.1 hypothetical protein DEO72_LG4g1118 [Vigna unguiculata]
MPQPQPWLPNPVRLPLRLAGAAPRRTIIGNTASPLLHQWARDYIFFSAPSAATTMHHARSCDPRHREQATASPSSRLRRASFFIHPAATTMAAPPRSRACLCRARKSPEPWLEPPTTPVLAPHPLPRDINHGTHHLFRSVSPTQICSELCTSISRARTRNTTVTLPSLQ